MSREYVIEPEQEPQLVRHSDQEQQSLEAVILRITDIATLPHVAVKVIEVANNPNSGAADLKSVLEVDASLSARVLRTVNSAAYSPRMKITNLIQAISYLGFRQIRNLALTASVRQLFQSEEQTGKYTQAGLWRHLVSVAICARMIAMRKELQNFEDAYLAGLLHEFGIILEDQHVNSQFKNLLRNLDTTRELIENENVALGFNHATLGATIAEKWKFPSSVLTAIQFHHNPQDYKGEDAMILHCVQLANFICSIKDISSVGINLISPPLASIKILSFEKEDLKVLGDDLDEEVKLKSDLFTL